jgi:hypothetical protein
LFCYSEAHASDQLLYLCELLRSSAVLVRSPYDETLVHLLAQSAEAVHVVLWSLSLRSWGLQGWKGTGPHSGFHGMSLLQWGQIRHALEALINITGLRHPAWVRDPANPLNRMGIFAQLLNHLASGLLQTADQVGVENPAPMFRNVAQAVLKMRDQMICLSQATRYRPAPGQMVPQAGGPAAPGLMGWGVPAPVISHQGFRYVENDGEPGASKKRKDRGEETEAQKEAKRRKAIREGKAPEKRPCVGSDVCGARALVPAPVINHQGFRYVENDGEPGPSKKRKDRGEEETEAQKEAKRRKAIREGKAPEKRPCVGSDVCGARALVPDPLGLLSDADDT